MRNGFFAFEASLHVFPLAAYPSADFGYDLITWNSSQCWRQHYQPMESGLLFFAEDVFGVQFGLAGEEVITWDPETGERERCADDLEGWAAAVLVDYEVLTGYPLAHEWQKRNRRLTITERLVPKQLFALGGEFTVENLGAMDAIDGMIYRSHFARQLRDLPDGARVRVVER